MLIFGTPHIKISLSFVVTKPLRIRFCDFFPEPVWIKYTFCFLAKYLKEFYSVLWCDAGLWHVTCGKYWAIFQIIVRKWSVNKCGKCHGECVTRCHPCHWSVIMRGREAWCQDGEVKPCITDHYWPLSACQYHKHRTVFKDSLWIKMKTLNYFDILFTSFSSRVSGTDDT